MELCNSNRFRTQTEACIWLYDSSPVHYVPTRSSVLFVVPVISASPGCAVSLTCWLSDQAWCSGRIWPAAWQLPWLQDTGLPSHRPRYKSQPALWPKYYRLGALHNRNAFSHNSGSQSLRPRCQQSLFLMNWGLELQYMNFRRRNSAHSTWKPFQWLKSWDHAHSIICFSFSCLTLKF